MLDNYIPMDFNDPKCFHNNKTALSRPEMCPVQVDIQYLKEAKKDVKHLS